VFSPNSDGFNDSFSPIITKGLSSINLAVYNRWGTQVYSSKKMDFEWTGSDLQAGTYFYVVNYMDINSKRGSVKGSVTILK